MMMLSRGALVVMLGAMSCIPSNEAVRGGGSLAKPHKVLGALGVASKVERSAVTTRTFLSHQAEQAMMQKMTAENAINIISKLNHTTPEVLSTLQQHLHLTIGSKNLRQPDGGVAAQQAADSYGSGAQKALTKLNEMLLEAIEAMDFEVVRCDSEERTNLNQLEAIREDIIMFNGMAAGAATTMNKAKGDVGRFGELLIGTQLEFTTNRATCNTERLDIEAKLKIVTADLGVMRTVVAMTDCGDSAAAAASLFQCVDTVSKRTWSELRPQQKLKDAISKVQNPKVRELLSNSNLFLETHNETDDGPGTLDNGRGGSAGDITADAAATTKCTLASSPMCPKIREKFTNLAGEVFDSWNELKLMLYNLNLHCAQVTAGISAMITNFGNVISETNEKLSGATKDWGTYSGQKVQKDTELKDVSAEHLDTMTACTVNIENLASEKCALKKIRGELLKMDSLPTIVTDCDVGDWSPDACSVSCGGGVQDLTRSLTPGKLGSKCPAGKAEQSCNERRCPVDCVMEEWSEWGSCTALCGGGIKEKARGVTVAALTAEADQCGDLSMTVPCNVPSCMENCELGDWTQWATKCSKPCGGGEVTRAKPITKPAFGGGQCAAFYDATRHENKACNTQACPPSDKPFTCTSKTDVIILVDGSGSLGQEGWTNVKKGAAELAEAFVGQDVKIATLLFSGPTNFDMVGPCIGMINPFVKNASEMDAIKDCGMEWQTRFDENKTGAEAAAKIREMKFPQGTTLTSMALAEANAEVAHGRSDANTIVIVFTDGAPLSTLEVAKQSEKLRKKARVMFVPVGNKIQDDTVFHPWCSVPWEDNFVRIKNVKWISKPWAINAILTEFCPLLWVGDLSLDTVISKEFEYQTGGLPP